MTRISHSARHPPPSSTATPLNKGEREAWVGGVRAAVMLWGPPLLRLAGQGGLGVGEAPWKGSVLSLLLSPIKRSSGAALHGLGGEGFPVSDVRRGGSQRGLRPEENQTVCVVLVSVTQ